MKILIDSNVALDVLLKRSALYLILNLAQEEFTQRSPRNKEHEEWK